MTASVRREWNGGTDDGGNPQGPRVRDYVYFSVDYFRSTPAGLALLASLTERV